MRLFRGRFGARSGVRTRVFHIETAVCKLNKGFMWSHGSQNPEKVSCFGGSETETPSEKVDPWVLGGFPKD